MEVIRKKICIENYISRTPTLIKSQSIDSDETVLYNSWGNIPYDIIFNENDSKQIKYGTLMRLYNKLYNLILTSNYYEYDKNGKKWININLSINKIITGSNIIKYVNEIPNEILNDKDIIGIMSEEDLNFFYHGFEFLNIQDGFSFLKKIDFLIGKVYVPDDINGVFVPNFIFLSEVEKLLEKHSELSSFDDNNCCGKKRYDDYGGEKYQGFLLKSKIEFIDRKNKESEFKFAIPYIELPILITQSTVDLGQYKSDDIDVLYSDEISEAVNTNNNNKELITKNQIVITSCESKLSTLRKRKHSYSDDCIELPGIFNKTNGFYEVGNDDETMVVYKLDLPYSVGYIKNIQTNNDEFYGDLIYEITEKCTPIFVTSNLYNEYTRMLDVENEVIDIEKILEDEILLEDKELTYDEILKLKENDFYGKIKTLKNKLLIYFNSLYPNKLCLKQKYSFKYNLKYIEDGAEKEETIIEEDYLYLVYDNCEITFTYVLGGKLKYNNGILTLDEKAPYLLNVNNFNGSGMWYRETYPLRKVCVDTFSIDNKKTVCRYDEIDFESNYILDNIGENHILCNDVRYKSDNYLEYCDNDFVFRDEKMLGLNYPLKENYDVNINRGTYRAFDRHLQLGEIKTFDDLEKYRNGIFLNK